MGTSPKPAASSPCADGGHPAVHHVGGGDDVGAGLRVGDRLPGQERERQVVVDREVLPGAAGPRRLEDPAVAVVGVLAHADVGHHDEPGDRLLERPDRPRDDAVLVVGAGADRVLVLGDAEEDDRADARLVPGLRLGHELVHRELEDARHGLHRVPHALAREDEERPDEVVRGEGRLADEAAERLGAAHAAGAILGEGHGGFSSAICGCGQRRRGAAGRRYGRSQGFTSRNTRPLWRRG